MVIADLFSALGELLLEVEFARLKSTKADRY